MLGIYEKALPKNISWLERLTLAKELGFDFVEMSIDETDQRIERLDWNRNEREKVVAAIFSTEVKILSICLSAHRRFPFGSSNPKVRKIALEMMEKAIILASDLGIRTIQLAGYDVYYEEKTLTSRFYFIENLKLAVSLAASRGVVLALEVMDDVFMNSISKFLELKAQIPSPYLQVYPDLGNLSAWSDNDVGFELEKGIQHIVGIHIKDTLAVTPEFPGKFKEVPFGSGCVDFGGCFKTLKTLGYSGPFLIEMWSETATNPKQAIQEAKAYILPILKEAGFEEGTESSNL